MSYLLWNIFHLLKHLTLNSIIFRKTIGDCFEKRGNFQLNSGQHMIENVSVHLALSTKHILRTLYKLAHFILTEILVLLLIAYFNHEIHLTTVIFPHILPATNHYTPTHTQKNRKFQRPWEAEVKSLRGLRVVGVIIFCQMEVFQTKEFSQRSE